MLPYLGAAGFASMASVRIADPMLPALAADFGGDANAMAPVVVLFTLAYGVMLLVWGPLGDRLGKLRVIGWAALAATVGTIACALAPTLQALSIARLATGACCAAIIPMAIAHVGDTVPYDRRQATLARLATGTLTGLIAGQVLGGFAADTVGWRAAFGVLAALFVATGVAVLRLQARLAAQARPAPPPAALTAGSVLRGWRAVLGDAWARRVLGVGLLEGALVFGALAFVPSWLHARTGMSLSSAGMAVGALGAGGLAYALVARRLIPRLGESRLLWLGGALVAVGFTVLFAIARETAGPAAWPGALAGCGIAGVGFYMLHNTMQALATQLSPQARATAVSLFAVSLFVGQSIGVSVAARLGAWVGHGPVVVGAGLAMAATTAAMGIAVARRRAS